MSCQNVSKNFLKIFNLTFKMKEILQQLTIGIVNNIHNENNNKNMGKIVTDEL